MSCNLETAEVIEGSSPIIPFAKPVSIISPTYIPQREGEWIPKNDLTLMFAGERIPSGIQEYAATAQELKTKEEIYSAMVVYGLLTYDNGMVFIPNKELMEVLKWELVMIKKQKNTPVK